MFTHTISHRVALRPYPFSHPPFSTCSLQQRRLVRYASHRFLRVAVATAEAPIEVPAEADPASDAAPAPAAAAADNTQRRTGGGGGNFRRGGNRGGGNRRPQIGPERNLQLDELEIGKSYNGAIVSVTDFGAFVNVGCVTDGLLHISQISTEFVRSVSEAVSVGEEITVRIIGVDADRKKFSVTAIPEGAEPAPRRSFGGGDGGDRGYDRGGDRGGSFEGGRQERPRQARAQKSRANRAACPVAAGDVVSGPIANLAPFGVFVDLGSGFTGMLHASQMKLPEGVDDHLRHYKQGDELEVRVLSVARGGEKVALTQKSDEELATEERTRTKGLSAGEWNSRY